MLPLQYLIQNNRQRVEDTNFSQIRSYNFRITHMKTIMSRTCTPLYKWISLISFVHVKVRFSEDLFVKVPYSYKGSTQMVHLAWFFVSSLGTQCQGELLGSCFVCRPSSCVVRRVSSVVRRASTIYLNIFFFDSTGPRVLILGMQHHLVVVYQVC